MVKLHMSLLLNYIDGWIGEFFLLKHVSILSLDIKIHSWIHCGASYTLMSCALQVQYILNPDTDTDAWFIHLTLYWCLIYTLDIIERKI